MKRQPRDEERRRRAVDKGWNLIQNYRREDPERHTTGLSTRPDLLEIPLLLQTEMRIFQSEVLSWLESGLVAWFGFYFAIGDGSPQSRLTQASEELDKASERLEAAAKLIAQLPSRGTGWHGTVAGYGDAVAMWGTAIDLIANGARFDRAGVAREGLERMDDASAAAERVVDIEAGPAHLVDLKGPLWTLERLKPSKKVPAKAIDEAKRPWERALIASGSMLDWSPFPS